MVQRRELVDLMQVVEELQLYQEVELQHALQLVAAAAAMVLQMVQLVDQVAVEVTEERVDRLLQVKEGLEAQDYPTAKTTGLVVVVVARVELAQHQRQRKQDLAELDLKFHGFRHPLDRH